MLKVLFLDDSKIRHRHFYDKSSPNIHVDYAYTVKEALGFVVSGPRYDYYFLDHDLNGEVHVDRIEETGYEFVLALKDIIGASKYPELVILHSYNSNGAIRMSLALAELKIKSLMYPFGSSEFKMVLDIINEH